MRTFLAAVSIASGRRPRMFRVGAETVRGPGRIKTRAVVLGDEGLRVTHVVVFVNDRAPEVKVIQCTLTHH